MDLRLVILVLFFEIVFYSQSMAGELLITKVQAGNNQELSSFQEISIDSSEIPVLKYNQNYLIFYLTNTDSTRSQTLLYKLEGLDYNWIECQDCSQIQYAHLDGGDYRFLIKRDSDVSEVNEFAFQIEGNIWHQWWFIPLLLLFFLGISGIGFYFLALYKLRQGMQAQLLVHKEKIAAMVDLTAGVAHEIQNPLNFVNNFTELSSELVEEAQEELANKELEEVGEILTDLKGNLTKISNHGARASNIIREMQAHARPVSTEKSPTRLNEFCQSVLEIAYRNFQNSNDALNIELVVAFDGSIKPILISKDEIQRVLMNILSNAFYACSAQAKLHPFTPKEASGIGSPLGDGSEESERDASLLGAPIPQERQNRDTKYSPMVTIITQQLNNSTAITIKDNGIGMSQETMDKVFQPFFTTKPTGQGTGLGMSISYDIITKGHGGELRVESERNKGSVFIIKLPTTE